MAKYLLDSVNSTKNKDIEIIVASKDINELLNVKNPSEILVKSTIANTISDMAENIGFYKVSLDNFDASLLISELKLDSQEQNRLNDLLEANDVKGVLYFYEESLNKRLKDTTISTYDFVGSYTKTINSLTKKSFIDQNYMNTMVSSLNDIRDYGIDKLDITYYLIDKVKYYINEINDPEAVANKKILVNAHKAAVESIGKMSNSDIIKEFYKECLDLKPKYDNLLKEFINEGFVINNVNIEDKIKSFDNINNVKTLLSKLPNIQKEKLSEVKQVLELIFLKDKDLMEYLSKDSNLKTIRENSFLKTKNLFNDLMLNNEQINKIKLINNIANFNASVQELHGTELNINVSELFYKKFGVLLDDKESKKYTSDLFDKYVKLKDSSKNKNNNILLYIALESFDEKTKQYDKDKESLYINLLTKPHNKYTEEEIKLLDGISDSWLKWAICYNREFQDNTITFTNIHPTKFNFSEFQAVKKELGRNLNKVEIEMVQVSSLFPNLSYNDIKNYEPKEIKEIDTLKEFVNLKDYNIKLDSFNKSIDKKELYSIMNLYVVLNDNKDLMANIEKAGLDISSLLKSEKDSIKRIMNKLNDFSKEEIQAIGVMLENPKVIPNKLDKFEKYIKFFASQMGTDSYKNYKKEDSQLPIVDAKINKNYQMKSLTIKEFASIINGDVCNHCMSYDGASWEMIPYMFKNPNNFYITQLEKDGEGVANSATWKVENQVCFDSIELINKGQGFRDSLLNSYKEQTLRLLDNDKGIDRVTFGYSNHNNKVDFTSLGISTKSSNHHFIKLPENIYSDAKTNQDIIYSLNKQDLQSSKINDFMIESLYSYSKSKDVNHSIIKSYLVKYDIAMNELQSNFGDKIYTNLSSLNVLKNLLNDYGIKNNYLNNDGTSQKFEEIKNKLENKTNIER